MQQKNIHAILQQRKLRHLHGVCIRNLQQAVRNDSQMSWLMHIRIYDKQSSFGSAAVIFKSETISFCSNPTWMGFCLDEAVIPNSNTLHLELWMQKSPCEKAERVLAWSWNLLRLQYVTEKLSNEEISYVPNALILQIGGGFYSFAETFNTDTPHGNCPIFNLDEEKMSYNVFSIRRMVTCQKSIAVLKMKSSDCSVECGGFMDGRDLRSPTVSCETIENLKTNIKMIKLLLQRETIMLKCDSDTLKKLESEKEAKHELLKMKNELHSQEHDRWSTIVDKSILMRQKIVALNRHLSARRLEVLSELAYIFPIAPYTPPTAVKSSTKLSAYQSYTICSIYLPDAESLVPKEDVKYAVAMGFVCQMLHMISFFLATPLRYPLLFHGSQSVIIDDIIEKVLERDRNFPLYVKSSRERFLFEYGVYLLNKDIAQIRFLLGIPTPDLRPTLVNVKSLLELTTSSVQPVQTLSVSVPPLHSTVSAYRKSLDTICDNILSGTGTSTFNSTVNGVGDHKAQHVTDRIHHKVAELNSMREDLLGKPDRKASNAVLVLPRDATPSLAVSRNPSVVLTAITAMQKPLAPQTFSGKSATPFLSGLEDLDNEAKITSSSRSKLDFADARNELFRTRSGRPNVAEEMSSRSGPRRIPVINSTDSRNRQKALSSNPTLVSTGGNAVSEQIERYTQFTEYGAVQGGATNAVNEFSFPNDDVDLC